MLTHWPLIEADLQDIGIDVHDPAIRNGRSWVWLRTRITGLLTRPPVGQVRVHLGEGRYRLDLLWGNRLQTAMNSRTTT